MPLVRWVRIHIIAVYLIVYMNSANAASQSKLLKCTDETFVSVGDTITLNCSAPGHTVRWLFRVHWATNEKVIYTGSRLRSDLGDRFSVEDNGAGRVKLTILNATSADAGVYRCRDMFLDADIKTEDIIVTDGQLTNFAPSGSSPTAEHACAFKYHGRVRSTMELVSMDGTILVRTSDANGCLESARLNTSDRPCDRPRYCRVTFHFRNKSPCYIQIEQENSAYKECHRAASALAPSEPSSPAEFYVIGVVAGAAAFAVMVCIAVKIVAGGAISRMRRRQPKASSISDDETSISTTGSNNSFDSDRGLLPGNPNGKSTQGSLGQVGQKFSQFDTTVHLGHRQVRLISGCEETHKKHRPSSMVEVTKEADF